MALVNDNELQVAQIEEMLLTGEIESGKGANQINTVKRADDTRWSSNFTSITSLIRMYNPSIQHVQFWRR